LNSSGGLIDVYGLAYLGLENSTVTSTTANNLIRVFANGVLDIINSTVTGGVEDAVQVTSSAHAFINARGGKTTRISNPGTTFGQSIGCWNGEMTIVPDDSSTIIIGPSPQGIAAQGCHATIGSFSDNPGVMRITQTTDVGIRTTGGDSFHLVHTRIVANSGRGVEVGAGTMLIEGSTIGSNGSGLWAESGGIVRFRDVNGVSQVTDSFNCYQHGRFYADPGFIAGKDEPSDDGCLLVGEPSD
jgi:hypothetical protein